MSLEIIEYDQSMGESGLIALIKQRTGLEMEALDEGTSGRKTYSMRFPDMETSQKVKIAYLNDNGTFFIDTNNHFLCFTIKSGVGDYEYVDYLYKIMVFDVNGKLANICDAYKTAWQYAMNIRQDVASYYLENDNSKNIITLCPLRAYGPDSISGVNSVRAFVKNCYVNYERQFQRNLKFIDQNGNRFVTLGGYLLYKID